MDWGCEVARAMPTLGRASASSASSWGVGMAPMMAPASGTPDESSRASGAAAGAGGGGAAAGAEKRGMELLWLALAMAMSATVIWPLRLKSAGEVGSAAWPL